MRRPFDGFGSILATPGSADPDCAFGGVATITTSLDGNGSCGAAVSADPLLGALTANGGETLTRLP